LKYLAEVLAAGKRAGWTTLYGMAKEMPFAQQERNQLLKWLRKDHTENYLPGKDKKYFWPL